MLADALHAPGPAPGVDLDDFGRLVGAWDLDWTGLGPDGAWHRAEGELHVGWVLGGRAVQDVWIVPGRGRPGAGLPPLAFHGTTVRFRDPAGGRWLSTWMDPVNGRVRRFVGRRQGEDVVLLSDDEEPRLRWRFTGVTPGAFTWSAETSRDRGATWVHDERMAARRHEGG
ncbi:hypothetical protein [Geodermatophilus marinus]|uniref:hypothetical protein n=1 Tax=Geodermatophilus sp. LHW52908 TaxID=2303986 RepID=UPI000E3E872E|nr:hypothetical protein [Geodermatophilus sp. LHW52908]RFU23418.1 hypothetical protein D0Z06_01920 [Geodermatophilus sp. LHW52908]